MALASGRPLTNLAGEATYAASSLYASPAVPSQSQETHSARFSSSHSTSPSIFVPSEYVTTVVRTSKMRMLLLHFGQRHTEDTPETLQDSPSRTTSVSALFSLRNSSSAIWRTS